MGNKVKAPVEAVRTYHLKLDTRHHLDLHETLYVPILSRNLVSLFKLVVIGYSFNFSNRCSVYLSIIISFVLVFFVMVNIN